MLKLSPLATFLISGSAILENIVSMIVLLLPFIWVDKRIWGCKQFEDKSFINLFIYLEESSFSRSVLKSLIRIFFIIFFQNLFWTRVKVMIIEGAYIHRWMSVNTTNDNIIYIVLLYIIILYSFFGKIISTKIDSRWHDL